MKPFSSNEAELAWVIGFWEGEGSVRFQSGGRGIEFSVSQKDQEPLEKFQQWLWSIGIESKINPMSHGEMFNIRVSRYPDVQKIYNLFAGYLSDRREMQFTDALEDYLAISVRYGRGIRKG